MKHLFFLAVFVVISFAGTAQGKSGKEKDKQKDNPAAAVDKEKGKGKQKDNDKDKDWKDEDDSKRSEHDRKIWDGLGNTTDCGKPSKNQPAKVRSSFQRDYPRAAAVRWTKCRGDWTATFGNGLFLSTAVYHANGERKDTRTPLLQKDVPFKITDIFKRRPQAKLGDVIKIEVPRKTKDIFRVKTDENGVVKFQFYDADGAEVQYDY